MSKFDRASLLITPQIHNEVRFLLFTLPDDSSPDYIPTLIYKARAHLALGDNTSTPALPTDTENIALRAATALARGQQGLETLRDLCVEIEGDDDSEEWEKEIVQVLAATAFILPVRAK
jgi:coatomer protein complex subunit epsilon